MMKVFLARLGLSMGLVSIAVSAWALSVSPGRTEIRLAPGKKIAAVITASNDTPDLLHVKLSTKDWFLLDANKTKNLVIDQWLKLHGKKEFDLKPGQSRKVKITARCPKEAEGELVGMVSFLYEKDPPSMVTPIISVSVYVEVAGTEKASGEIRQVAVQTWNNQIQLAVDLKSTGNVHLRPSGSFTVVDARGVEVATFPVKEGAPAYPGRDQGYFAQIPPGFKLASGRYAVKVSLQDRGLAFQAERGFQVLKDGKIQMDSEKK